MSAFEQMMEHRQMVVGSSLCDNDLIDSNCDPPRRSSFPLLHPNGGANKPSAFSEVSGAASGDDDVCIVQETRRASILGGNWKKRALHNSASMLDYPSFKASCSGYKSDRSDEQYNNQSGISYNCNSNSKPTASGETTIVRRHRRKPPSGVQLTCRVCGDDACGYNFDALTCHSCKLFFRRNAYRTLTCPFTGNCQMDRRSRKFCASCRLNKCFSVGMLRELIKLRYVQKNYHQKSSSSNATGMQERSPAPGPRLTPPDTPESVDRANEPIRVSEGEKRAHAFEFNEPSPVAKRACVGDAAVPLSQPQCANQVAKSFLDALRSMFAPQFDSACPSNSSASALGDFGSPLSVASASFSCATPASSYAASSIGTRCSSAMTPRTRSVLSEYEYDSILLQCHSFWHSLLQTMVESDVFGQNAEKPIQPHQVVCGPTTVRVHIESGDYLCTYFELGIRRAIGALRLVTDFADLSPESQMKLLKAGLLSVLNVITVNTYDSATNTWSIRITREQTRNFSAAEVAAADNTGVFGEFLKVLGTFHSELRERFAEDHVPFVSMSLIQLFDPARFASDSLFAAQLRRLQHKHVNFLRKYIHRHYQSAASGANADDQPDFAADSECRAHALLHFCIDQLATTVRVLEQYAQRISTQFLVPNSTAE